MQLDELNKIIQNAGGQCFALGYAESLLEKINRIESVDGYGVLITQFQAAREEGDLRGRVLEINFASLFVENGAALKYGAKQGMLGDVDFCWEIGGRQVFIEMKLLGQDQKTRAEINQQLEANGFSKKVITDDTWDVARIQRDIFGKSSTTKFNPHPQPTWVNLVAIDVSELQLGTVDLADCLLAAAGNEVAAKYCNPLCLRPNVVGVFEHRDVCSLRAEQKEWVNGFHPTLYVEQHPRDYIHGVLFLFREPKERAALCYQLSGYVVWNSRLVDVQAGAEFCKAFHRIVPFAK